MWRFRVLAGLGVLTGILIFGAVIVHAGWYWNAEIDVEGIDVRTIWTVVDDEEGAKSYHAAIVVGLPEHADAKVVSEAETETVHLVYTEHLACTPTGIESVVGYRVVPLHGAVGELVEVTVTADGVVVGHDTGHVGEAIKLRVLIPTDGRAC